VTAERAFLARLGAGCRLPVGAYAEEADGRLHLRAFIASDDGLICREETGGSADAAEQLGIVVAERLLSRAGLKPAEG
jgi:hydroxymethylbilane synthase